METKDVVVNGRTFRLRKFGARDGSFIAIKVAGLIAPVFKDASLSKLAEISSAEEAIGVFDVSRVIGILGDVSEKDFAYLQGKSLAVCSEVLGSGLVPVLRDNGTFGVQGVEEDAVLVTVLTAHALIYNLAGFFSASGLGGLLNGLSDSASSG